MSTVSKSRVKDLATTAQLPSAVEVTSASVKATAKDLRVPPRKMGQVAALVRNRSVQDAQTILEHTPRKAAVALSEVIKSATANATNNHQLPSQDLRITDILVSSGKVQKGYRAGSRGRPDYQRHRRVNVTVIVSDQADGGIKSKKLDAQSNKAKPQQPRALSGERKEKA